MMRTETIVDSKLNYVDLFSGIGGFPLGMHSAGWRVEKHYFSEIDPWCAELYQKRFPDAIPLGDIRQITDLPKGDWVITGGFPCTDISIAGRKEGIHAERSSLWFEMQRIIGMVRPRFAIVENVWSTHCSRTYRCFGIAYRNQVRCRMDGYMRNRRG